ncbi:MAG: superinfection immunity protein [Chlorobium sp.]
MFGLGGQEGTIIFMLLASVALFFVPSIIAYSKKKRNKTAITVLIVLLAWFVIGWIIELVWTFTYDIPK